MTKKIAVSVAGLLLTTTSPQANAQSAEYHLNFQGTWNATDHPTEFPSGAHFTRLTGATHNSDVTFWEVGGAASPGVELVAELGSTSTLVTEVNNEITAGRAQSVVFGTPSFIPSTGTSEFDIEVHASHPLLTFASMVAPSPDWFVGVSNLSLLDPGGQWIDELTVNLYAYDAGTEEGDGFSLSNPATVPHGVITRLHGPSATEDLHPFVNPSSTSPIPQLAILTITKVPEPISIFTISIGAIIGLGHRRRIHNGP